MSWLHRTIRPRFLARNQKNEPRFSAAAPDDIKMKLPINSYILRCQVLIKIVIQKNAIADIKLFPRRFELNTEPITTIIRQYSHQPLTTGQGYQHAFTHTG